ncbi:MFS transporter [Gordonia sp. NPDC127522]|uniref:MFS transporter n=1 Tax=Gordonia sp. NPDC127522 TaxID=3345390 RepID=UPI003645527D
MSTISTAAASTRPDGGSDWSPRLVLSLFSFVIVLEVITLSAAMTAMAIPAVTAEFTTTQGAWLLASFLLVGAVCSPVLGKLADTKGKRRILLLCITLGTIGSVVCAVAPTFPILIAGRAIAGFFGAALFLSYSLIRDVYPRRTVPLAVSIATSGMGVITVPLPFLTGWFLDNHGFRSIYWFMAAVLVVGGILIAVSTPESPVRLRSRIDPVGALLLGGGIGGLLVGVSFGTSWGWTGTGTLFAFGIGAVLLISWYITTRVVAEPLIDLAVVGRRRVLTIAVAAGFCYGTAAVATFILPIMIMAPPMPGLGYGFGATASEFAWYQSPLGLVGVAGGVLAGYLIGRSLTRPRTTMIIGLSLLGGGSTVIAMAHASTLPVLVGIGLTGLGIGVGYASIPNLQIEAVSPELQATTASMVSVTQNLCAAVFPVLAVAVMSAHMMELDGGVRIYSGTGMTGGWIFAACVGFIGAVVALLLPRRPADAGFRPAG